MSNPSHTEQDQPPSPDISRPSRLAWWLHPKVALPLTLFVLILLGPFLYRSYRISSIPDIGDPFDVAAFEAIVVPASDNAAEIYAAANAKRVIVTYKAEELENVFEHGWGASTEALQKLLAANQSALNEWRRGTERPSAQFLVAKGATISSILPTVQELGDFSRLARLRAERCLHEGDVAEAWHWLRANVRASRHLGQNGVLIERLVGTATFNLAAAGINRWAADLRVDENLLREAAEQFDADEEMTPLTSVGLKHEYVWLAHTIDGGVTFSDLGMGSAQTGVPDGALPAFLFVTGEPDFSRRLLQQTFAGWIEQADLPKPKRAPVVRPRFGLFSPPPKPGRLSAEELESRLLSLSLARALLPALSLYGEAIDREAADRASLKLTLAAQRYYRRHGDWSGKLDDLVPDYIKELPADPLGKAGETLLLKRDGDDLIIYSVGDNGIDDGGSVAPVEKKTLDEGFRLKRPRLPSIEK